jgi:CPA2 family monovalent cation:H+ antiporter-2
MTAEGTDFTIYREAMIVLATAAVLVPLGQRFRLSPILGFLIAGAVLGPHGLGALKGVLPPLQWITVSEERGLGAMAELGVVFLLFIIGLELSLTRLITMRRLVFGLGTLQVSISAVIIGSIAALYGAGAGAATLIGFSLALSSTAVVIEVLSRQGRLSTITGRTSFSILLLQDLAVVPLLFLVNILGPESQGSLVAGLAQAFGQAILVIALIAVVGKLLLRPMFRSVAAAGSTELFVAAALFVAVGSGLVTAAAGLSMALGAFVAGLLLSETEYHRAVEATIEPFKGLLLGVFFFSVGMSLDVSYLWANPLPIVLGLAGLIAIKSACSSGSCASSACRGRQPSKRRRSWGRAASSHSSSSGSRSRKRSSSPAWVSWCWRSRRSRWLSCRRSTIWRAVGRKPLPSSSQRTQRPWLRHRPSGSTPSSSAAGALADWCRRC